MPLSVQDTQDIIDEYKRSRTPFKVARKLGIDVRLVWQVIENEDSQYLLMPNPTRFEGMGRPALRKYIVARKKSTAEWDNLDPKVAKARKDYEAGAIEMATGRDGSWLILYAIPRRRKAPRPGYFTPGE